MQKRFRRHSRKSMGMRLFAVFVVGFAAILVFEAYQVIVPFQSANPLWQEVTVGESVLGDWKYGGMDEEGYLRFYSQGQTVLLPPKARTFDAEGQFVVIEGYTPSSLTYAKPYEAVPFRWWLIAMGVIAIPAMVITLRARQRKKRVSFRKPISQRASITVKKAIILPKLKIPTRSRRFHARRFRGQANSRRPRRTKLFRTKFF